MTVESRMTIARALARIVTDDMGLDKESPLFRALFLKGLRQLAQHAQHLTLKPEDVLEPGPRDALSAIARAIGMEAQWWLDAPLSKLPRYLVAEWLMVLRLAEHFDGRMQPHPYSRARAQAAR